MAANDTPALDTTQTQDTATQKTPGPSIAEPSSMRGDIFGGITAGVVALPLALAFGEASGAGPIAGLWGAIIVGFLAAVFGGTPTQVSGPTGPMIVVFAGIFDSLDGDLSLIFAAVVLAGLLQVALGVLRLGRYINLVPYPVVSGFMSGIGIIIILLQASRLFGGAPDGGGTINAIRAIPMAISEINSAAFILAAITLLIVFLWPPQFGKYVPGALTALIVGTALGQVITGAPLLGDIPTGFPEFVIPAFSGDTFGVVLEGAIILALLGAIDSLLTSLVADNMTRTRHNSNRELIGQGVGNSIAGLFGGIPGAGATMRTVINVRSGGRTRISGAIHSAFLLAVVLILGPVASQIPQAVLAGILVKVGWDILDLTFISQCRKGPRLDLVLMVIVLLMTVFVDLITAVGVGVVLAALAFVKQLADRQLDELHVVYTPPSETEEKLIADLDGRVAIFELSGPLSFGAAADLAHRAAENINDEVDAILLDFTTVPYLDASAARAIDAVASYAQDAEIDVYSSGLNQDSAKVLAAFGVDGGFTKSLPTRLDALSAVAASPPRRAAAAG